MYKVNAFELTEALKKVLPIVPEKSPVPILSTVLLEFSYNLISITASNLAIQCSTAVFCESDVEQSKSIAISAKQILKILKDIKDDVYMNISDEFILEISIPQGIDANAEYHLSGYAGADFPIMENNDSEHIQHNIPMSIIADSAGIAGGFVSDDELKVAMNNIFVEITPDAVFTTSTDAYSLYHANNIHDGQDTSNFLMSPVICVVAKKMFHKDGIVKVKNGIRNVSFEMDGDRIFFRKLEERFPQFRTVIPHSNNFSIVVIRAEISSVLDRISNVSNSLDHSVRISILIEAGKSKKLKMQSENEEKGSSGVDYVEIIDAPDWENGHYEIAMDSKRLSKLIQSLNAENIRINFGDNARCITIEPETQEPTQSIITLLMPLRLK